MSRTQIDRDTGAVTICPNVIDFWSFSLECSDEQQRLAAALMTPAELQRAEKFRFERDRRRFVLRRAIRRIVLAAIVDSTPDELVFEDGHNGKPQLVNPKSQIEFSTSHSAECGVIVVGGARLGVDVESLSRELEYQDFADHSFTAEESAELLRQNAGGLVKAFFCCWTGKEAYIKATGQGLSKSLKSFAVRLSPGQPPGLRWDEDDAEANWQFWRMTDGSHLTTIAAAGTGFEAEIRQRRASLESLSARVPIIVETRDEWRDC